MADTPTHEDGGVVGSSDEREGSDGLLRAQVRARAIHALMVTVHVKREISLLIRSPLCFFAGCDIDWEYAAEGEAVRARPYCTRGRHTDWGWIDIE